MVSEAIQRLVADLRWVPGVSRVLQEVSCLFQVSRAIFGVQGSFRTFQGASRGLWTASGVSGVSEKFQWMSKALQGVLEVLQRSQGRFKGFKRLSRVPREFQGSSRGLRGTTGVSKVFEEFQEYSKEAQRFARGYLGFSVAIQVASWCVCNSQGRSTGSRGISDDLRGVVGISGALQGGGQGQESTWNSR